MTVRSEAGRPGAVRSEGAYSRTVHSGWHLVAFLSELTTEVTPLAIGPRRLVAVRDGDDVRLFDANCPHRGAHLGYGGTLDGNCLVCPFHGKRIALGDEGKRWSVAEHQVLRAGEAVFARLTDTARDDRGFEKVIKEIAVSHPLVEAVVLPVAAPSGLIIENAFDTDHFTALHKVEAVEGMDIVPTENGELAIEGTFPMRNSPGRAISPGPRPSGGRCVTVRRGWSTYRGSTHGPSAPAWWSPSSGRPDRCTSWSPEPRPPRTAVSRVWRSASAPAGRATCGC